MVPTADLLNAVTKALLAMSPVRWARDALGRGRAPRRGSLADTSFWRAFAARYHLAYEHDDEHAPRIHGDIEGIAFTVGRVQGVNGPLRMTAASRALLTVVTPLQPMEAPLRTGDERFDAACKVHGDPREVFAVLEARARTHVAALLAGGGQLTRGQATLTLPTRVDEEAARAAANLVFHAAYAIDHAPSERLTRLLRVADEDPVPAVRARALWSAATLSPTDAHVQERLTRASRAPTDRHQDWIGRAHAGALDRCAALLLEAEDPSLIHLAAATLGVDALASVLTPLRDSERPDVVLALAEVAVHLDPSARLTFLDVLGARATLNTDDGAAALKALATSCRSLAGEAFDATFARLCAHPDDGVAETALGALLQRGSVRAVPGLRAAEGCVNRARAERIRSLVAAIQARVGPVDAGRLTLATEDGRGRLAVLPHDEETP